MSKLDEYKDAKTEHETICSIIADCKPSIGMTSQNSSGHDVQFLFWLSVSTLQYRVRLATMLGRACAVKLNEIVETAKQLSELDVAEKARAAQAEAIETLQNIRIEKAENNVTQQAGASTAPMS